MNNKFFILPFMLILASCASKGGLEIKEPPPDPRCFFGNRPILLPRVFFPAGSDTILYHSKAVLDDFAETLIKNPHVELLEVQGHTDSIGNEVQNNKLSIARAIYVKEYLVQKGVDPSRLVIKGYSDKIPIKPNSTSDGRANNRRCEFIIIREIS